MMYSREVADARHRELMAEASRRALAAEAARSHDAPQRSSVVSRVLATWLRRAADKLDARRVAQTPDGVGCTTY